MYHAIHYSARNPADGTTQVETRILPTLRAVELWAQTKLKGEHIVCTNDTYHQDVARAASVTYRSTKTRPRYHMGRRDLSAPSQNGRDPPSNHHRSQLL
jgi:hypothetical protein